MARFLTVFIWVWVGLVVALNVIGIIGLFLGAPTVSAGFEAFRETYSPFNLWTHGLNIILLLPVLGAWFWRDRITR